ncbi:serine-rich coiled-coil domain-containing protein 2 [Amia ocellicauda]|uniref:serine-rich coiled-coil domain-containing protein 2 n=1 Tax=Amia ocellicauda TaxID=2972642 RepID=UPI00346449A0
MEEKPLNKPTMVSRLPKFGARAPGSSGLLPNGSGSGSGSVLPGGAPEGKGCPVSHQNGIVRMPSFSLKWKQGSAPPGCLSSPEEGAAATDPAETAEDGGSGRTLPSVREIKKPSAPTSRMRKAPAPVAAASATTAATPRSVPQTSVSARGPSRGSGAPPRRPLSGQNFYSGKMGLNGLGGGSGRSGSGLHRPRANSGSARSSSRESLTQSSDSLRSGSLESIVRSQSFSHGTQLPSPPGLAMTRSYSFNKAAELAKVPAHPQQRGKVLPAKSAPALGVRGPRPAGGAQVGTGSLLRPGGGVVSAAPLGTLKKPLLPSAVLARPSALSYKRTRPSLVKSPRPLLAGREEGEGAVNENGRDLGVGGAPPEQQPPPLLSSALEAQPLLVGGPGPRTAEEREEPVEQVGGPLALRELDSNLRYLGDGLEDMSLSSASSLERNDTSEEYLDDFDNLGDGGGGALLLLNGPGGAVAGLLQSLPSEAVANNAPGIRQDGPPTQTHLSSFLADGMDWVEVGLPGSEDDFGVSHVPRAALALSPDVDFPVGSSLELSPSDSSGGTYMWDEEGMGEPLGTATHPCGSYDDSEINSMDILNNLENLESGDLEDDDLMLDIDLPEDGSLHSGDADGMDRSERGGRQGHWRRRHHRWSGPDHFHNDNRAAGFLSSSAAQYEGFSVPGSGHAVPRPLQPAGRLENSVVLDELTLRHMAQDCTSVKTQLLNLRRLLQMGDSGRIQDSLLSGSSSPEPLEEPRTALQVEELMKEVQQLREELRSRDQTIQQLRQQASAPPQPMQCVCQQRPAAETKSERRSHHDKFTQTPWRGNAPQILQPSSPCRSEFLGPGRLARTAPTEGPSDRASLALLEARPWERPGSAPLRDAAAPAAMPPPAPTQGPPVEVGRQPRVPDAEAGPGEGGCGAMLSGRGAPERAAPASQRLGVNGPPRVLQPPRFHKRVSVPTLSPEGAAWVRGPAPGDRTGEGRPNPRLQMPASSASTMAKQQPHPPPGIQPGLKSQPQALGLVQVPVPCGPHRPLGLNDREQEGSIPQKSGLLLPSHSRLPKPKIH